MDTFIPIPTVRPLFDIDSLFKISAVQKILYCKEWTEIVANNNLVLLNASPPSAAAGRARIREERVPHLSTAG